MDLYPGELKPWGGGGALKWDFTVYEMQWGLEMRNDLHSLITI